jgi:hypothetical protein
VKTLGIAKSIRKAVDLLNDLGFFPYIFPDLKVNTDEVIEGSPIGTVALMLRENDPNKLKNTLIDYRYEAPEASAVTFLIRLQGLTPDNAFLMKKMQDRSSLKDDPETVREFARRFVSEKLADAFADYKVTTSGTELEEQGFKGEAIGKEMNRVETEKFKALLH